MSHEYNACQIDRRAAVLRSDAYQSAVKLMADGVPLAVIVPRLRRRYAYISSLESAARAGQIPAEAIA